jgi:NADH-quinone oxidoreductase subunit E
MYHKHPVGKFVVTVCNNLSCALGGATRLIQHLENELKVRSGQTTSDGLITLEVTSECLAACDNAPCMQVNLQHYHRVTPEKAQELLAALRKGELPAWPESTSMGDQSEYREQPTDQPSVSKAS